MHVITRQRLQEFWHIHPEAERPLKAWLAIVRLKRYSSPVAVREDFASVCFLGKWRIVFNIGGNKYRLVVDMRYELGRIDIRHVLTHEEYTRRIQDSSLERAATPYGTAEGEKSMTELLDFTKPHVLRNEVEYTAAVAEIDQLLDLDPPLHSEAYERLEFLAVLVHAYEEAHFPLAQLTTPQDVVTFMLDQKDLAHTDLAQWLGGESLMLAFLQGTCSLSLPQIERLREHLGIPADLLISPGKAPNV